MMATHHDRYVWRRRAKLHLSFSLTNWTFGVWWARRFPTRWAVGVDLGPLEAVLRRRKPEET